MGVSDRPSFVSLTHNAPATRSGGAGVRAGWGALDVRQRLEATDAIVHQRVRDVDHVSVRKFRTVEESGVQVSNVDGTHQVFDRPFPTFPTFPLVDVGQKRFTTRRSLYHETDSLGVCPLVQHTRVHTACGTLPSRAIPRTTMRTGSAARAPDAPASEVARRTVSRGTRRLNPGPLPL
jgi:hypothetical protein